MHEMVKKRTLGQRFKHYQLDECLKEWPVYRTLRWQDLAIRTRTRHMMNKTLLFWKAFSIQEKFQVLWFLRLCSVACVKTHCLISSLRRLTVKKRIAYSSASPDTAGWGRAGVFFKSQFTTLKESHTYDELYLKWWTFLSLRCDVTHLG